MTHSDEAYMSRCLELAQKGIGWVSPNPMVGALVVHHDKIIGEGYHQKYGEAHAEVNAINSVKDQSLLPHSTLYVNLEPCAHHGKTPPCADLIVENKIPKVVIGCIDSFSKVSGKGISRMKKNGIEVITGILEEKSRSLNKRFFTLHEKKRPYIILKWAQSSDGFLEPKREEKKGSIPVTSIEANVLTHQWRHEETAILIGKNTLQTDNPQLNTRLIEGRDAIPIVLSNEKLGTHFSILQNDAIWIGSQSNQETMNIDAHDLVEVMHALYNKDIQSVLVEGGKKTLESFISSGLYDEIRIWEADQLFVKGLPAPAPPSELKFKVHPLEKERLLLYNREDLT